MAQIHSVSLRNAIDNFLLFWLGTRLYIYLFSLLASDILAVSPSYKLFAANNALFELIFDSTCALKQIKTRKKEITNPRAG